MPVPSYRQQLFHTESCRASLHTSVVVQKWPEI
jgi:hypothetical protein